jgi:tRNA 5-methylaminomethyl-2-thiouridine biosynthesis bifunctional protein
MNRENTPWQPATAARLEWPDEGGPRSLLFGDIYYSRDNGLEESRQVFLRGNNLPERWRGWPDEHFAIAETGFGTGLNFLLTWQAWLDTPEPRPALHYIAVEKYPLAATDLARALDLWPGLHELAQQLLAHYPGLVPGQHRLLLADGRIRLDLWWEDVGEALADLAGQGRRWVDAWYLDGFAPASNESMWQAGVMAAAAQLSRPGATLATFTAAGLVRRNLDAAGFRVSKVPGYGRKRESLRAHMPAHAERPDAAAPPQWDTPGIAASRPARVIVLGAGLAGCTVAAALARRGVAVSLLDQGALAGAGSGNDQGILYTRLSTRHAPLIDFALQSFCFSSAFYGEMFRSGALASGEDGELCGSFHQHGKPQELAEMAGRLAAVPELASVLSAREAEDRLGVAQHADGYWYPRSGWLCPGAVCRALVGHPLISVQENCSELALTPMAAGWQVQARDGSNWQAPCVVVATGTGSMQQAPLQWLPLQAIRGQTTTLPAGEPFSRLRAGFCHEGYIAPARAGSHCIGATFKLRSSDTAVQPAEHGENLDRLGAAVPAWADALAQLDPAGLAGRVGFRCASPDYLPLVGPVPDREAFLRDFAALRKDARNAPAIAGQYLDGLYLSTAHGSRGLTSAPLAAELLASQVCGEAPPLSRELCRALAPARFIIRDLRRNRNP